MVQHGFSASELSPAKDLLAWYMFLPVDTKTFAKAAQVELMYYLDVSPMASPSFTGEAVAQQLGRHLAWSGLRCPAQ